MVSGSYTDTLKAFIKLILVVDRGMRPNIGRLLKHKLVLDHIGKFLVRLIDLMKKRTSEFCNNCRYSYLS